MPSRLIDRTTDTWSRCVSQPFRLGHGWAFYFLEVPYNVGDEACHFFPFTDPLSAKLPFKILVRGGFNNHILRFRLISLLNSKVKWFESPIVEHSICQIINYFFTSYLANSQSLTNKSLGLKLDFIVKVYLCIGMINRYYQSISLSINFAFSSPFAIASNNQIHGFFIVLP